MSTDNEVIAREILEAVGGRENIAMLENCMTRLRFDLVDKSKADRQRLEGIEGVKGLVYVSDQCQLVMGEQANDIYKIYARQGIVDEQRGTEPEVPQADPARKTKLFDRVMDTFAGSLTPVIPIIIACGLLQVLAQLLLLISPAIAESDLYKLITYVGQAGFYYLPIFLGYFAARKMNTRPAIGMLLGAVLVYPDLAAAVSSEQGIHLFGLSLPNVTYNSTVIPILLVVWVLSYVDRLVTRIVPKVVSSLLTPLLLAIIMVPITLLVVGPLGVYAGNYIAAGMQFLFDAGLGWIAVVLLAGLFPLLVMCGAHWAVLPISLGFFSTLGFDPLMSPAGLAYNSACAGVALAVAVKSRNTKLKSAGFTAAFSAYLGITEPALYAIGIRLRRPMAGIFAGAIVAGLVGGLLGLRATAFMLQGIPAIPAYADGGQGVPFAALVLVLASVTGFAVTYFRGFHDPVETE